MIPFLPLVPNDGSSASDCLSNFATTDAIVAGLGQTIKKKENQQCLNSGITFTCHGFITKWILAAEWGDEVNYPELQTWNSTDGIMYTKQGATTFSVEGGSTEMTFYEYTPDTPHEFHDGDVLGMFIPDKSICQIFFEEVAVGPLNYFLYTGTATTPPVGDFTTSGKTIATAYPLLAVEVRELEQYSGEQYAKYHACKHSNTDTCLVKSPMHLLCYGLPRSQLRNVQGIPGTPPTIHCKNVLPFAKLS